MLNRKQVKKYIEVFWLNIQYFTKDGLIAVHELKHNVLKHQRFNNKLVK